MCRQFSIPVHATIVSAFADGQIGRFDEAHAEWREALRVNPDYSTRRTVMPYKNPNDFERVVEDSKS